MTDDIRFDVDLAQFRRQLNALDDQAGAALMDGVMAGALTLEGVVKRDLNSGGRTGRTYKRGSKTHTASAPGEPPATDMGALANSFVTRKGGKGKDWAEAETGPTVEYGAALEYGTSRMAPRPYMRPGLDNNGPAIVKAIEDELRRRMG